MSVYCFQLWNVWIIYLNKVSNKFTWSGSCCWEELLFLRPHWSWYGIYICVSVLVFSLEFATVHFSGAFSSSDKRGNRFIFPAYHVMIQFQASSDGMIDLDPEAQPDAISGAMIDAFPKVQIVHPTPTKLCENLVLFAFNPKFEVIFYLTYFSDEIIVIICFWNLMRKLLLNI